MNCQPCQAGGSQGECLEYLASRPSCHGGSYADIRPRKFRQPDYAGWTADEINDHEHDLGIGPWETKYDDLEWERRDQEERTSVPYEIGGE